MEISEEMKKLPNRLTMFRIVLVIGFIPCVLANNVIYNYVALGIFIIASITDFLDGHLARKFNVVSNFGKVMDPLADKILVFSAFICFVELGLVPAWMVVIIISRDFFINGIRMMAAHKGDVIEASWWGKTKTIMQIATIIVILFLSAIQNTIQLYEPRWENYLENSGNTGKFLLSCIYYAPYWMMFVAAIFALVSGFDYFFKTRKFFDNEV
ncbi:MAG: CDP-diacylglycerol--glycerol-3-phosphate 3-phosphatidyltransferase [bacterium]